MELIPAIDLLGGRVVRLAEGRRESAVAYADDPAAVLAAHAAAGARRIHLVDLDGAFDAAAAQTALVERLCGASPVPVQVGGGIRSRAAVERLLAAGADRVVLGTAVVEDPALLAELGEAFPGRIVVAVDARDGKVATRGWTAQTDRSAREVALEAERAGAAAVLYTDIARDGLGTGPNVAATIALQGALTIPVIASGGIGSIDHVRALVEAGARACVVGRALYEGRVDLAAALLVAG